MFFGSKSIPGMARSIGKAVRQFKDAAGEVQRDIQESANVNLKELDLNDTSAPKAPGLPPIVTPPAPPKEEQPGESKTAWHHVLLVVSLYMLYLKLGPKGFDSR